MNFLSQYFYVDSLAFIMTSLVSFVALCVSSFAIRYMKGDTHYIAFFIRLALIVVSVMIMVSSDHLALLCISWSISNALLVRLMMHKPGWKAAKAASMLALKNYILGAVSVAIGCLILYQATGLTSVQTIIHTDINSDITLIAAIFLLVGAMTQSAIWPYHRWLTSSLNSPTPVSAMMHAGLVNGGGFLLARFAPLYIELPALLTCIFIIGMVTALIGTLWKLMQTDVKRMLACSTMGQMGFMLAQCGLGLFPAAVAHLVWHGLFKAYLFLASGGAAQEKRFDLAYPPQGFAFLCATLCGIAGSIGFTYTSGKSWFAGDTTLVLIIVAFIAACQFALPLLRQHTIRSLPFALVASILVGLSYGWCIHLVTGIMEPMGLMQPQPLNFFHIIGIMALIVSWLSILFLRNNTKTAQLHAWMTKYYVSALNASQPHASTITASHNQYHY